MAVNILPHSPHAPLHASSSLFSTFCDKLGLAEGIKIWDNQRSLSRHGWWQAGALLIPLHADTTTRSDA